MLYQFYANVCITSKITTKAVMSAFTDMKYNEKISHLMAEYHLSHSRIEDIVLTKDYPINEEGRVS